ncbi:MAG: SCO1664 family protein [Anaerolineae bacterium]|nr:SCO1664 family protein [Anaerolineae bacterium]
MDNSPTIQLAEDRQIALTRALEVLSEGTFGEEQGRLRWSSNFTFLVELCHNETRLKAIYKPQRGERPLWDFPDGTLCYREVAAYRVSEALGWHLVPPTMLREARGLGSVQLFIEHNPEITYFNLDTAFIPVLQQLALFDFITNNADRKGGHCLVGAGSRLWAIDHGICFHVVPKLRTVIWNFAGDPLPADLSPTVEALGQQLCDSSTALYGLLAQLITPQEIEAMVTRVQRLLKAGKFPKPGHGPSYPWPPV